MMHIPGLFLSHTSQKGRGVFTAEKLEVGDVIEVCPVIKIPSNQVKHINQTILYEYYFNWEEKGYSACIALGYGSLYNHSPDANAEIILDYDKINIVFKAIRKIGSGDEICIDYTGGIKTGIKLWFISDD